MDGKNQLLTKVLPSYLSPTNQRAELTAITLAGRTCLGRFKKLDAYPYLQVKVKSDSRYVVGYMTEVQTGELMLQATRSSRSIRGSLWSWLSSRLRGII
jgi:ribonuclease HI